MRFTIAIAALLATSSALRLHQNGGDRPSEEGDRPPRKEGDRPPREEGDRPPREEGEEGEGNVLEEIFNKCDGANETRERNGELTQAEAVNCMTHHAQQAIDHAQEFVTCAWGDHQGPMTLDDFHAAAQHAMENCTGDRRE